MSAEKKLPAGWEVKKLGEVARFQRGLTYSKSDEVTISSNIVLRANNIDVVTNSIDLSDLKYINDSIIVPQDKKVYKKSLLICTASGSKSHLGKVAIIDSDYGYAFGGFMGLISPMETIDHRYLFYSLISEEYKKFINALSAGVNINNLRFDALSEYTLNIPPLAEQKRIVTILDEAFQAIDKAKENAKKNLANARKLFESYLNQVFSNPGKDWEEKKLSEVCDVRDGTHDSPRFYPNGYPLITSKNLKDGVLNYDNIQYISEKDFIEINKRSKVNQNDILFAMIGTIGNPVVVTGIPDFAIKNVALFKPYSQCNSFFLKYFMESNQVKQKMEYEAKGSTQKFVGLGYLRSFPIMLPPYDIQEELVKGINTFSSETKRLESLYTKKLAALDELKKSILQRAFSGEL